MSIKKEINILDVVFKEKTHQIEFNSDEKLKALEFGKDYWDNPDYPGYSGYIYDGRWEEPAKRLLEFFNIKDNQKILDVCCGKGYMVYDLWNQNPTLQVRGIDISEYAINNAKKEIKKNLILGSADVLPFKDNSLDLVISLNSLYMLPYNQCINAIKEIERVGKQSFIQVFSYRNEIEKENLIKWDCTAKVIKNIDEWKIIFKKAGYTGYYYWNVFL